MNTVIAVLVIVASLFGNSLPAASSDEHVGRTSRVPPVVITESCIVPIAYDVPVHVVQDVLDRADEFIAQEKGVVISWCPMEERSMSPDVTTSLEAHNWIRWVDQPGRLVLGFTDIFEMMADWGPCGWGRYPTAQVNLSQRCKTEASKVALHELFHILGAVAPDAPDSDGSGHSVLDNDLLGKMHYPVCIDCGGDSYFNPNPIPGGFLEANPERNTAFSPLFLPASTTEEPIPGGETNGERVTIRLSGANRFETAVEVALYNYPYGSRNAYLVDADAGADALVAASVVQEFSGPILYTTKEGIPQVTRDALNTLGVTHLYVIGGEGVVPDHATR